jgi:hypothetical protein
MSRHLSRAITLAALAAATACAVEPTDGDLDESTTVQAATPVQDMNAAEGVFRNAVTKNVTTSATAAGVRFASTGIKLGYHQRNRTVAAGRTTTGTQAIFLSRSVARPSGSFAPGLYELSLGATGPQVHHYHPTLGKILVAPPSGPVGFHTPFGDDVCPDAPAGLADYCQRIAACFAYDLFC